MTEPSLDGKKAKLLENVERALAELRRGGAVLLRNLPASGYVAIVAAEYGNQDHIARLSAPGPKKPVVAITGRRAMVLGLISQLQPVALFEADGLLKQEQVSALVDPLTMTKPEGLKPVEETPAWGQAAVVLAKLARLLPAVIALEIDTAQAGAIVVDADQVLEYRHAAAQSLFKVSDARVPLIGAENAHVLAFRPSDGGQEHLAIVIGEPDVSQPVLTRLHSECFTGDVLGSMRCDCGDQLRGAIQEIGRVGSGVLLYLAQEGRGIGLINKLRAYQLQDQGFDTLDANLQLGFDDDERVYLPAAEVLRLLGIHKVRLMTNNPNKVNGLERCGVEVTERVPHVFPSNEHNVFYLKTKATRSGHLF